MANEQKKEEKVSVKEKKEEKVSVKEKKPENAPAKAKRVKIKLPRLRDQENTDVFVAVNGENYTIKRGVEVEVPDYIAEVLRHSEEAEAEADEHILKTSS